METEKTKRKCLTMHRKKKKQSVETVHEEALTLVFLNKDFNSTLTNMFKDLKKTLSKELRCENFSPIKRQIIFKKRPNRNSRAERYRN